MEDLKKRRKRKSFLGIGVILLVVLFCFGWNQGGKIQAEEEENEDYQGILIQSQPVVDRTYVMEYREVYINYQVREGSSIDPNKLRFDVIGEKVISKRIDSTDGRTYLKAIGVGRAIIECVDTSNNRLVDTCTIWVKSAFYQNELFFKNKAFANDTIVLNLGKEDEYAKSYIELMFAIDQADWQVVSEGGDGTDIVKVKDKGKVWKDGQQISIASIEPVGTGKARIDLYYTEENGTGQKQGPFSIDVYVGPNLTVKSDVTSGGAIQGDIQVKSGEFINPGTKGIADSSQKGQKISDKIEWIISDKEGKKLTDSNTKPLEILTYEDVYTSDLKVEAKAGTYIVTFAPKGCLNLKEIGALVKTYEMIVFATPKDKDVHLQIGDSYDVAEVFNVKSEDFGKYFKISPESDDDDVGSEKEYGDAIQIDNATGMIEIRNDIVSEIKLVVTPTAEGEQYVKDYKSGTKYKLTLNVFSEFVLNYSNVEIPLNGSPMQLKAYYNNEYTPFVTWSVAEEDKKYVSVDKEGNIKGTAVTTTSAKVIATIKKDGRILNAVCSVTVYNTATQIKLSTNELNLKVKGSDSITAEIIINSSSNSGSRLPELEWLVEDPTVAKITNINDTTTEAEFVALKAGITTVTVINTENYKIAAYCKIFVTAPINSIELEVTEAEVFTGETYKLVIKKTDPEDAKDTGSFIWETSDPTIAEVNNYGVVTFKDKAGEVVIRVYDDSNTSGVAAYARCTFIVKESASDITLPATDFVLEAGEEKEFLYTISSDTATSTVDWFILDGNVATFSKGGSGTTATTEVKKGEEGRLIIKAGKAGKTFLVAKTAEGYLKTCTITVTQKATGLKLDKYNLTLAVGESETVKATPDPEDTTNPKFTWSSGDPNIATVDNNGKITGVAPGSTFVTVTTTEGRPEVVYVDVYGKATGMKLNEQNITLPKGNSYTLKPVFTPENVTNKNVTYTSLAPTVATVSEKGKLTALKAGSTIITAISDDGGYIATCLVNVTEKVTSITLDQTSKTLAIGDTFTLVATVESNSASNPKVKWTTSNKKIATVNQSGKVTAKKPGTVTIKAKVTDGTNKTATCKVKVVREVTKVTLNKRLLTMYIGDTKKLKVTIKPTNATIKDVKWTSSDKEIVEVVGGELLALKEGTVKITATAKDTSKKKATCHVNVIKREEKKDIPVSNILLSAKDITLVKGQAEKINYTLVPYNHTDKIYFDSTNKAVATVSSAGTILARKAGSANIIITTRSGKQEIVTVTVLGLNKTKVTMQQYDTEILFVEGVSSGISWFSSNPGIATVSAQGKIVARKEGTCTIIAKVKGVNLSCQIKVTKIR